MRQLGKSFSWCKKRRVLLTQLQAIEQLEIQNQKKFITKKNHLSIVNNYSENNSQSGQALDWFFKENSCSNRRSQQDQSSNTPSTRSNVTIMKKNKKPDDKDLSEFKRCACNKKSQHSNKFSDKKPEKPVMVSATYTSMIEISQKKDLQTPEEFELQRGPDIYYSVQFDKTLIMLLIDLSNKVNMIQPSFIRKLGLYIYRINIDLQKIDSNIFETFNMVITLFQVEYKNEKCHIFGNLFQVQKLAWKLLLKYLFSL